MRPLPASKSLSPVLRLGSMVLPTDLVGAVIEAEGGSQFYVDGIAALTTAEFITSGGYVISSYRPCLPPTSVSADWTRG